MANELLTERPKAPDFDHWESPETRVRWERGLAIVAGMVGIVFTFFFLLAVLPLSPDHEAAPIRGAQQAVEPPAQAQDQPAAQPQAAATAAAQAPPPGEQRLSAVSRAFPNVRRGPALDAAVVRNLTQGQKVDVVARSNDNQWLQILNPDNSRERLWVSADMLDVTGDFRTLPVGQ